MLRKKATQLLTTTAILLTALTTTTYASESIINYRNLKGFPKAADYYKRLDSTKQPTYPATAGKPPLGITLSGLQLLAAVNTKFNNQVKYLAEPNGSDHWQTPAETAQLHTGDCEDYALAKMQALLSAGLPESSMQLLQGSNSNGEMHAILQILYNNQLYYLDNQTNDVLTTSPLKANQLVFTTNRFGVTIYFAPPQSRGNGWETTAELPLENPTQTSGS